MYPAPVTAFLLVLQLVLGAQAVIRQGTWKEAPPFPTHRVEAQTFVHNGSMFVVGE